MIDNVMNRTKVLRGSQLSHAKLDEHDVELIREIVEYRERLKQELKALSNASLADKFGVHIRTIDKITSGESWIHV
jgi:hypothetical protein